MPDLLEDLISDGASSSNIEKKQKSKPDSENGQTACNDDRAARSKPVRPKGKKLPDPKDGKDSMEKLAEVMQAGFQNLQQMFQGLVDGNEQDLVQENIGDGIETEKEEDKDLFTSLASELPVSEKLGPAVSNSLATLTKKLLTTKPETCKSELRDKYPRPQNIDILAAPQVNKPLWGNLPYPVKTKDCQLQSVQKEFLNSAIPVLEVMGKLNDASDDLNSLDVKELLRTLCDSLSFIGSANVHMVRTRRQFLKNQLPSNMHLLCQDSVEFSGTNLFGDSLSSDIKEVTELNKISGQLRGRGNHRGYRGTGRFNSGRGFFRGNLRSIFKRGGRGRYVKRFNPSVRKNPLNREGPSSQ